MIRLEYVRPDSGQRMRLAFLRPARLLEGLVAGDTIKLSILELQVQGRARVLAVEPCPAIEHGPGQLVTGTIRCETADVSALKLIGLDRRIGVTAGHPLFSEDRLRFVPARDLRPGERLRTRAGTALVESVAHQPGTFEVFNLEVGEEHRYYVSELEVLAHNAGGCVVGISANGEPLAGYGPAAAAPTAEQLRNTPGIATVSAELERASGAWLDASRPNAIPAQVAAGLKGQRFNSFGDLRAAIWRAIAGDEELRSGLSAANVSIDL